jgi:hypothetical protein
VIALAFVGPPILLSWDKLQNRAKSVEKAYDLKAMAWVNALKALNPNGRLCQI